MRNKFFETLGLSQASDVNTDQYDQARTMSTRQTVHLFVERLFAVNGIEVIQDNDYEVNK